MISILIPVYNAEKWLEETIRSALDQKWENIEIIRVESVAKSISLFHTKGFESDSVKVFSHENKGASAARNRAFQESKGDYIQYLDADDILTPNKIKEQMIRLLQTDHTAITSGPFEYFTDDIEMPIAKSNYAYRDYEQPIVGWFVKGLSYGC